MNFHLQKVIVLNYYLVTTDKLQAGLNKSLVVNIVRVRVRLQDGRVKENDTVPV
jgi:hypothetical protein